MLKRKLIVIPVLILILCTVTYSGYILNLKSGISQNLLRLHIIGASNSEQDQNLKLAVRDRILADFSEEFSKCTSATEAEKIALRLKSEIENSASAELLSKGCTASVTADVEECRFPTKTYGSISLPGGQYTALNIRIGEASGKNWWCVMYPPLCITDKSIIMSEHSKQMLKDTLSDAEYSLITQTERPDIKIKFRIAEILGKII